jgi:hypothetical protein
MNALKSIGTVLLVVCALPVFAQEEWEFTLEPRIWGAGLAGALQIGKSEENLRVNYSDNFGGAEAGVGLAFEANNGRYGLMVEGIYLDVDGGAEPPSILREKADVSIEHQIWSIAASYRLRPSRPMVDAVVGFRYIDANADMRILENGVVVRQAVESEDWLDFTFGARVAHEWGEKWSATGVFDFGDGDSKLSYQLNLVMAYRFNPVVSATFGYRVISTDFVIREKSETVPPAPIVVYHYGSMKIGGPFVGVRIGW